MSTIGIIKTAVKTHLDTLKTAGTLGQVIVDDFKTNPLGGLYKNISAFPAAIVSTPGIASEYETNRDNLRAYTFEILVIFKGENVSSITSVEDTMESLLNAFDNDPTLGGAANGAVSAASSPEQIITDDGSFILFAITLTAKATYTLT